MSQKLIPIKATDFEKDVLDHPGVVLVEFFATWCGHCRMFAPVLETFAKEQEGKVKVVLVDVDQALDLVKAAGVKSTPTIILFDKEKKKGSHTGAMEKGKLEAWIEESLAKEENKE